MILVINSGSSSIKFKLFLEQNSQVEPIADGLAERIGIDGKLKINYHGQKYSFDEPLPNHEVALLLILEKLKELQVIKDFNDIQGVGFRVVHGGKISTSSLIDETVFNEIKDNVKLAPLHNPGAIIAIEAVQKILPNCPLVACFDTAFHQTMGPVEYLYPVPKSWFTDYDVRKYGFHGISYEYIVQKMSQVLEKPVDQLNLIVCHLGNGASITAIKNGKSLDTSMGLTPLAGLMMGTRSGNIDPGIIEYMVKQLDSDVEMVTNILNKESGVKGMSGLTADMRDLTEAARQGNEDAKIALDKYTQIVADYIVEYANKLGGDFSAIVFTAGIGENSVLTKQLIIEKVQILGLEFDETLNEADYDDYLEISKPTSRYPIYKVRTDEETMICLDTIKLISSL